MSAGHTQGNWSITDTIRRDGVCKVTASGQGLVAIVGNGFNIGTYENDARLISAAKDLLEALQGLLDGFPDPSASEYELVQGGCSPDEARKIAAARNAIAKATGASSYLGVL